MQHGHSLTAFAEQKSQLGNSVLLHIKCDLCTTKSVKIRPFCVNHSIDIQVLLSFQVSVVISDRIFLRYHVLPENGDTKLRID